MNHFIAPLINKIVTIYTVKTAVPVAPERFPMVYTGKLKAYDPEEGVLLLENTFFRKKVLSVFLLRHVINISEEPEIDQNSEEYKDLMDSAAKMKERELQRMTDELMPQAMEQAKKAAMQKVKEDYGVTLTSPERGSSG